MTVDLFFSGEAAGQNISPNEIVNINHCILTIICYSNWGVCLHQPQQWNCLNSQHLMFQQEDLAAKLNYLG